MLQYARRRLDGSRPVAFAHRYITRPCGEHIENYVALSRKEFALRRQHRLLAFGWTAFGFRYGVGIESRTWLVSGLPVAVDGSRAYFAANRAMLRETLPVLITASEDELRRRLMARRRDDARAIEQRLKRARKFEPQHPALITIDNSVPPERAGECFAHLLMRQVPVMKCEPRGQ